MASLAALHGKYIRQASEILEELQSGEGTRLSSKYRGKVRARINEHLTTEVGQALMWERIIEIKAPNGTDAPAMWFVEEIVRHEYAHILAWTENQYSGHGKVWKEAAKRCGVKQRGSPVAIPFAWR